jgi:hypothetical protein
MTADPMWSPALIALLGAVLAGLQILMLAGLTAWIASRKEKRDGDRKALELKTEREAKAAEKAEDYRRQDEVAGRVENAARQAAAAATKLDVAQKDTIARTNEVARLAAEADERTHHQLLKLAEDTQKIHTLVNSDMTAARTAERSALKLLVIQLRKADRLSTEDAEEVTRVEKRIEELDQILADRLAAQQKVDQQTAHDPP